MIYELNVFECKEHPHQFCQLHELRLAKAPWCAWLLANQPNIWSQRVEYFHTCNLGEWSILSWLQASPSHFVSLWLEQAILYSGRLILGPCGKNCAQNHTKSIKIIQNHTKSTSLEIPAGLQTNNLLLNVSLNSSNPVGPYDPGQPHLPVSQVTANILLCPLVDGGTSTAVERTWWCGDSHTVCEEPAS